MAKLKEFEVKVERTEGYKFVGLDTQTTVKFDYQGATIHCHRPIVPVQKGWITKRFGWQFSTEGNHLSYIMTEEQPVAVADFIRKCGLLDAQLGPGSFHNEMERTISENKVWLGHPDTTEFK